MMRYVVAKEFPSLEGIHEWQEQIEEEFSKTGEFFHTVSLVRTLGHGSFEATVEFEMAQGDLFEDNIHYLQFPHKEP